MRKLKYLLFLLTFLLITLIPNINVKAISFGTNGYTCINFKDNRQYCSGVRDFTYDNIHYFGPDFSYTPDNLEEINNTVVDFYNQSFCSNESSGGFLNFRFYHNYAFENSVINYIQATVSGKSYICSTTLSQDGLYTDVSCPIGTGFTNQTLTFSYKLNDLNFNFPFTAGFSNLLGETCNISTGDIINSQNQNTQNIINNQNSNTQDIINNQNSNTQDIIDNQNSNTQDIIDNQNSNTDKEIESQMSCKYYDKNSIVKDNTQLWTNGTEHSNTNDGLTDYIKIDNNTKIKVVETLSSELAACFYDINKTKISCINYNNTSSGILTIPNNSSYFRATIRKVYNRPIFEICRNGNQALNDSVNDLNDTLNSDTPPDTENQLNDLDSSLISDTPITDLITLPISLLNSYITGFSGSCSPVNLGNLLGTDIIFPCLNLEQRLGSNLWQTVDSLFSIFMIYNIAMLMIQAFEGFTSLRDDYEGLYQPRHADTGYQPKHGGGN